MLTSSTGASLVAVLQHRHPGTAMPSGGVHPIDYVWEDQTKLDPDGFRPLVLPA